MKKFLSILLIIISICFAGYVIMNYSGKFYSGIIFLAGMTAGISLSSLKINSKKKFSEEDCEIIIGFSIVWSEFKSALPFFYCIVYSAFLVIAEAKIMMGFNKERFLL